MAYIEQKTLDSEQKISNSIKDYFKLKKHPATSKDINIHFIGCGGIGMCGLAMLCHQFGFNVTGSDISHSKNTKLLIKNGILVKLKHSIDNLPKNRNRVIVYSSAINSNNAELNHALKLNIPCFKRGQFLALISRQYKTVIAIAGSHGKTTVTSMLAHILKENFHFGAGYLIGGWPVGESILGNVGDGSILAIEVDESDLSLVFVKSSIGIILNTDDDHSWSVGGKDNLEKGFITFANNSDILLYSENLSDILLKKITSQKLIVNFDDYNLSNLSNFYGKYQHQNAKIAVAAAEKLGISITKSIQYLASYKGVERRMQEIFSNENLLILEDYAHHPSEINAVLNAVREKFPTKKLTVIFQPHRYARLKLYFDEFAKELKTADYIYIVPTFHAWSDKENITEESLAKKIGFNAEFVNGSWQDIATYIIQKQIFTNDILLILGAGDINNLTKVNWKR